MNDRHRPLTRLAHELLRAQLCPGDIAIDATAGNGHDTLFLAQAVGPCGRVHGFDIQPAAILATRARLAAAGAAAPAELHLAGHEQMARLLPALCGKVAAVTFNLGYLPGADHATTTGTNSTLEALEQALTLLRSGGALSVLAYRGHPGGAGRGAGRCRLVQQAGGIDPRITRITRAGTAFLHPQIEKGPAEAGPFHEDGSKGQI